MMIEPSSILTKEDMGKERTPEELSVWWEEKNREFASSTEGHHYALLKKGRLIKIFFEEIYPLMILANIKYMGRSDIGCIPNLGNDNFDAIVRDYSYSPPNEIKLEFTLASDGHDIHLRIEYLIDYNHVSLTSPLSHTGTEKTGHKIAVEGRIPSHDDLLENNFMLIKNSAQKKCNRSYDNNHVLVIIIDDNISPRFNNERDIKALKEYTETKLINLPLDFGELYILGLSGKTFLPFKILGTENSS
jgi:hypothetical protein